MHRKITRQSRWNLRRASDRAIPNQAPGIVGEGVETGWRASLVDEGTVRLSSKGESDRITQRSAVQIRPPQPFPRTPLQKMQWRSARTETLLPETRPPPLGNWCPSISTLNMHTLPTELEAIIPGLSFWEAFSSIRRSNAGRSQRPSRREQFDGNGLRQFHSFGSGHQRNGLSQVSATTAVVFSQTLMCDRHIAGAQQLDRCRDRQAFGRN